MTADPHIVATWVKGWTLARETAPPCPYGDGFWVDVGWPQQKARYVFAALSPAFGELARTIDEPWVFLKACASADAMRPMLPARWSIQRPGFLMTCAEPMTGDSVLPEGYTLDVTRGAVSIVRVLDRAREEAAIGHVVVVDGFAIYDRIETRPEHRRRGLARVVMKLLGAIGEAHGARCGVLVATPDGRALYESLGWELHSPYTTAVIPGD
ncbi:GNAT family N-acetyltransferase [Sphingobium sp. Ndbn-10]|uniref:GNAT family N-acetyltransferase n=1 Tax=Sphingobium sp. Ndbn-10 TaxID=1667223 RepID=UPI00081879AA|nr:GNAT family N-acetyltransferase [Sphingobium sp. Ndbn-10]